MRELNILLLAVMFHPVEYAWRRCYGSPAFTSRGRPPSPSLSRTSPQALTLLGGVRFIAWCLRHLLCRGIPTGPETFLEPPGESGRRPCTLTDLKKGFVPNSSGRWDVQIAEIYYLWHGVLLGRGCLTWVLGKPSINFTQPTILKPQGAVTPRL